MEYTNVKSLVPANEHFDSSAVGEGVWLSVAHLNAIESRLGLIATDFTRLTGELNTVKGNAQAVQTQLTDATNSLTTANATIQTQSTRILELEKKPAQEITNTVKEGKDEIPGEQVDKKASYMTSADADVKKMRAELGYK